MSDEMKRELNSLRADVNRGLAELRQETSDLRSELRQGLRDSRQEASDLRSELRQGMADIRSMFRRTMIHVANMTGDIAGIRHELAENVATKTDVSGIYDHLDDFAGLRKDSDFNKSKDVHRLDDFDDRLRKLEGRR